MYAVEELTKTYEQERSYFMSIYIGRWGLNEIEAEDLLHTAFLRALENIDGYRAGSNMRTWLFTISRNAFIDLCRKKNRRGSHLHIDDVVVGDSSVDIEGRVYSNEVLEVVEGLSPNYQEALYNQASGISSADFSRKKGVSSATIRARVSRAINKLKKRLE